MPEVAGGAGGAAVSLEGGAPVGVDWSAGGAGVSAGGTVDEDEGGEPSDSVAGGAGVDAVSLLGGAFSGLVGTGTSAVSVTGGASGVAGEVGGMPGT